MQNFDNTNPDHLTQLNDEVNNLLSGQQALTTQAAGTANTVQRNEAETAEALEGKASEKKMFAVLIVAIVGLLVASVGTTLAVKKNQALDVDVVVPDGAINNQVTVKSELSVPKDGIKVHHAAPIPVAGVTELENAVVSVATAQTSEASALDGVKNQLGSIEKALKEGHQITPPRAEVVGTSDGAIKISPPQPMDQQQLSRVVTNKDVKWIDYSERGSVYKVPVWKENDRGVTHPSEPPLTKPPGWTSARWVVLRGKSANWALAK